MYKLARRAYPRPSPTRTKNVAHSKSATEATSRTKLRVCYAAFPLSVWPKVRSIHAPWSISPVQGTTYRRLLSGSITRPSIRKWRPHWISEFFNDAHEEMNFDFTSRKPWQSSVIAHNLIVVMKKWGTGFLIWSALCCLSRVRSCSRYHFLLTILQFIFIFLSKWLFLYLFVMNSSFLFLFSFHPTIL